MAVAQCFSYTQDDYAEVFRYGSSALLATFFASNREPYASRLAVRSILPSSGLLIQNYLVWGLTRVLSRQLNARLSHKPQDIRWKRDAKLTYVLMNDEPLRHEKLTVKLIPDLE